MAKDTGITRYLIQRKGLNGWYFLRRVPLDLVEPLGKRQWRQKAGNSLAEAKRAAVVLLGQTEEQIARERAKLHGGAYERAEIELLGYSPEVIREVGVADAVEQAYPRIDAHIEVGPDQWDTNPEYDRLMELATQIKEGQLTDPKSVDEVVDQAVRLGGLAQKTEANYRRHGREFMEFIGKRYVGQVTSQDAKKFRDYELTRENSRTGKPLEKSYVKRKLSNLGVIFGVALESEWITSNPFTGVAGQIRVKTKVKQVKPVREADALLHQLPERMHLLYKVMRWTGMHREEAAGMRWMDIDLDDQVLFFVSYEGRGGKTDYRPRGIPIHKELLPALVQAKRDAKRRGAPETEAICPWAYRPAKYDENGRLKTAASWADGMNWHRYLPISPKDLRDWFTKRLRDKGVNERVIGDLMGHSRGTGEVTGRYGGSTPIETRRTVIDLLD